MGFLDGVQDHADSSPTQLDWTRIKDGLKWKTLLYIEKQGYADRRGVPVPPEDLFIFQALLDYLKAFKKGEAAEALRQEFLQKQTEITQTAQATEALIDSENFEVIS